MQRTHGKSVTVGTTKFTTTYVYGDPICCELRRVYPNGDSGAVVASGFGATESQALAEAIADCESEMKAGKL